MLKHAIFFISYHPGSLTEYDCLRKMDKGRSVHVLILCRHAYITQEIIDLFSTKYDHVIILPDIHYEKNIIKGFIRYSRFIDELSKCITTVLSDVESFTIVSDCSAYLPVNASISLLKNNRQCKKLISIREDHCVNSGIRISTTVLTMFYTTILGLYPVSAHKSLNYLYHSEPRDMIIKLISPFEWRIDQDQVVNPTPTFYVVRPVPDRNVASTNTIVFYSDRDLGEYGSSLSREEHTHRIGKFCARLAQVYRGCKIICKPHPLDQGNVMGGMEELEYEIYEGGLTSQMHLHAIIGCVRACYSVASTSLLHSASLGIPSYTLYKYLEYRGAYPKTFFEGDIAQRHPFLYNIDNIEDVGIIDTNSVEYTTDDSMDHWHEIMYSHV